MLDSNIIIALAMGSNAAVVRRAGECDAGEMVTSAIAYAEVAFGSVRDRQPVDEELRAFVEEVPVLDFDMRAARVYAGLPFRRASYDRLIAAHALALGLVIVTDNISHFVDIPELSVENWLVG